MATIAGHTFEQTPDGRKCKYCGRLFADISGATEADVENKTPGLAHSGFLNMTELGEIRAEVDRLWEVGRGA